MSCGPLTSALCVGRPSFSHERGQMTSHWLLRWLSENATALIGGIVSHMLSSSQWAAGRRRSFSVAVSRTVAVKQQSARTEFLPIFTHRSIGTNQSVYRVKQSKMPADQTNMVTCSAPVNIAVIKYCEYLFTLHTLQERNASIKIRNRTKSTH